MTSRDGILFIVENDYFPRDARIFNECMSLADSHRCYVLAPRNTGERPYERLGSVFCFRYPHFEASGVRQLPLEYLWAGLCIGILAPALVFRYRIKAVHVANPPDFLIPIICWIRLFGRRITFDVHDISVETFVGKAESRSSIGKLLKGILHCLEALSIRLADRVVTTNESIRDRVRDIADRKQVFVVRNSNRVLFRSISDVYKEPVFDGMHLGYFGVLINDEAAGLDNIIVTAQCLKSASVPFMVSVVGSGPGLTYLQQKVSLNNLGAQFNFTGYVSVPKAFDLIKNFDFGIVSWGYQRKNHLHTAMKVMDYMCCAVPICSLNLKEQLVSTAGIGVHADSFDELACLMADLFTDKAAYEDLRRRTLQRFNESLSWESQVTSLRAVYADL